MSAKQVLETNRGELLNKLINIATAYGYWHTNFSVNDLQSVVNDIRDIDKLIKELSK